MIGLFYLASVTVSHIGAVIKENLYNINAKVNPETNCYRDYYGNLRDDSTNDQRIELITPDGDFVLTDKKHNIVKNISEERRTNKCVERKNASNRDSFMETTICTRQQRLVEVYNPHRREKDYIKGTIYRDIDTGKDYFKVKVLVPSDYTCARSEKFFYVAIDRPYDLVRISDEQKEYEKIAKDNNKYNWIDSSEDAAKFVKDYNSWPYQMDATHDLSHTKKSIIHCL